MTAKNCVAHLAKTFSGPVVRNKKTIKMVMTAAAMGTLMTAVPVYAADLSGLAENIIDIISKMAIMVGVILGAWGVFQLVLAFKNDDPESKSRATQLIVVAAALISLPAILLQLGLTDYIQDFGS